MASICATQFRPKTRLIRVVWIELSVWVLSWVVGSLVFAGYEAHVPWTKRMLKLVVMLGVLTVVHILLGRFWFYGLLAAAGVGMAVLHGWWFHQRHGVHWRTAEPRARYLALIGRTGSDTGT